MPAALRSGRRVSLLVLLDWRGRGRWPRSGLRCDWNGGACRMIGQSWCRACRGIELARPVDGLDVQPEGVLAQDIRRRGHLHLDREDAGPVGQARLRAMLESGL